MAKFLATLQQFWVPGLPLRWRRELLSSGSALRVIGGADLSMNLMTGALLSAFQDLQLVVSISLLQTVSCSLRFIILVFEDGSWRLVCVAHHAGVHRMDVRQPQVCHYLPSAANATANEAVKAASLQQKSGQGLLFHEVSRHNLYRRCVGRSLNGTA